MRLDIVVDLETLGKGYLPPIIQVGAVAIDLDSGVVIDKYDKSCDITDVDGIEGDTLSWWLKTNPELLSDIIKSGSDSGLNQDALMNDFLAWLQDKMLNVEELYLWGNGSLFDNRIIKNWCDCHDTTYPIKYTNDRDLRTIYELAALKKGFNNVCEYRDSISRPITINHDALADAWHEGLVLIDACNTLLK